MEKGKKETSCSPLKSSGREEIKTNNPSLDHLQQKGWNQLQELSATLLENEFAGEIELKK